MVGDIRLQSVSIREAARNFKVALKASRAYSPRYLDALEHTLALFSAYAEEQGFPPVGELRTEHVEAYLVYLQERPKWFGERKKQEHHAISSSYVETHYRRLKRFFGWLVDRRHLPYNIMDPIPHPKLEEREVLPLSDEEQAALVRMADPRLYSGKEDHWRAVRNQAALYLFLDTPARRDEIGTLRVSDIDMETGEIKVMGKGARERWMPIGQRAQEALLEYLAQREDVVGKRHDRLWVDAKGKEMQPTWVYLMLRRLAERAGVVGFHTHRTRHNYSIRAVRARMPEAILRRIGGWKKNIPETYLRQLDRTDLIREHALASPLDKMEKQRRRKPGTRGRL